MESILDRKFSKVWQALKKNAEVKSTAWFKKADAAVSAKFEAYQKALSAAQSGLVEDLLKLGAALHDLEEAFVKFVDSKEIGEFGDGDAKSANQRGWIQQINRYKTEVQHERSLFDSRLKSALSAADNDLKKLESIEASKKKELWKGFRIEL